MNLRHEFQTAYDDRATDRLLRLFADGVVLHTTAARKPVVGKAGVQMILDFLLDAFENVRYLAEYTNDDGAVLLCTGDVAGEPADGIQVITFDAAGLIVEFRDFLRPLAPLTILAERAKRYVADAKAHGHE